MQPEAGDMSQPRGALGDTPVGVPVCATGSWKHFPPKQVLPKADHRWRKPLQCGSPHSTKTLRATLWGQSPEPESSNWVNKAQAGSQQSLLSLFEERAVLAQLSLPAIQSSLCVTSQ